ncbi:hypothetical protein BC828DRAFT_376583 [Blastocladiella britannica]|nr:hypothetical protein BC828DRAFT_376583 [Blastocladiella britannica]
MGSTSSAPTDTTPPPVTVALDAFMVLGGRLSTGGSSGGGSINSSNVSTAFATDPQAQPQGKDGALASMVAQFSQQFTDFANNFNDPSHRRRMLGLIIANLILNYAAGAIVAILYWAWIVMAGLGILRIADWFRRGVNRFRYGTSEPPSQASSRAPTPPYHLAAHPSHAHHLSQVGAVPYPPTNVAGIMATQSYLSQQQQQVGREPMVSIDPVTARQETYRQPQTPPTHHGGGYGIGAAAAASSPHFRRTSQSMEAIPAETIGRRQTRSLSPRASFHAGYYCTLPHRHPANCQCGGMAAQDHIHVRPSSSRSASPQKTGGRAHHHHSNGGGGADVIGAVLFRDPPRAEAAQPSFISETVPASLRPRSQSLSPGRHRRLGSPDSPRRQQQQQQVPHQWHGSM